MKRPARLTWSKVNELAHEKPVNGHFANSPFYGPLGPKGNRGCYGHARLENAHDF